MTSTTDHPTAPSPFHAGELLIQTRLGVASSLAPWASKVIRPFMPPQHREFYASLPFVIAAVRDEKERPWATVLAATPGFLSSDSSGRAMEIHARPLEGDGGESGWGVGARVGLLGIELATRRRNRVNGKVAALGGENGTIRFEVGQSFGNCPQYITKREWEAVDVGGREGGGAVRSSALDGDAKAWIRGADTMFIASGYSGDGAEDGPAFGMDASHRGGRVGFVDVRGDNLLVIPDYKGNNHFNTLGNLVLDPRVGLAFVDFVRGSLLQVTGRVEVVWDGAAEVARYPGAQRLLRVEVDEVVRLDGALPIRWRAPEGSVVPLRVARKVVESEDVVSFELVPVEEGKKLQRFDAGQYLPIELNVLFSDQSRPVKRTYSLSNSPGDSHYRISVKREAHGLASRYLHDSLEPGDVIQSNAPAGDFVLSVSRKRPVVLLSAGVGATPLLSMLHHLVANEPERPVVYIHAARDGAHHSFGNEVRNLVAASPQIKAFVFYSRPQDVDVQSKRFEREGRVTSEAIKSIIPQVDADFYLCGPLGFVSSTISILDELGVPSELIHSETFGPSA